MFLFDVFRWCLIYYDLFERHVKFQFKYTDRLHMTSYSKSNKMKLVIQLKPSKDVAGWKISSPINPKQVFCSSNDFCTPPSQKKTGSPHSWVFSVVHQRFVFRDVIWPNEILFHQPRFPCFPLFVCPHPARSEVRTLSQKFIV